MEKRCWKPGNCSEFLVIWDKTVSRKHLLKITVHFSTGVGMPMMEGETAFLLVNFTLRPMHHRINPQ